jgi:hypothetical protein
MSDIQDLIHKTTMDSIERGKILERERIIKLLEQDLHAHAYPAEVCGCEYEQSTIDTIALIKGETK